MPSSTAPAGPIVVALLLLGGAGKRLWPVSHDDHPKQFLKLFGTRSLFQMTVERARACGLTEIIVITNEAYEGMVRHDLAELQGVPARLLLEPVRRDSAAAIATGVAYARERFGMDTIIAAMPADHLIPDQNAFAETFRRGVKIACAGWITTFGLRPDLPSTEYGYIQRGHPLPGEAGAFEVERFHEKPDSETARGYLHAGTYDWNSGIFLFPSQTFAEEASAHMPDIADAAQRSVSAGVSAGDVVHLDPEAFGAVRRTSIDFALLEKSRRVATVPSTFGWSDIGNWNAVYEALPKDAAGNVVLGDAVIYDCRGSLVINYGAKLVICGLTDAVAISDTHGTFVAPRARAAEVKDLVGG
jgi:mannose-1-phosphate guanylyltransferase/mannose-6-phosphate isomerase